MLACDTKTRNYTSLVAVVTQTDLKSVCNGHVIELLGGLFVLALLFVKYSVGVRAIVIGLSQNSSIFSKDKTLRQQIYMLM